MDDSSATLAAAGPGGEACTVDALLRLISQRPEQGIPFKVWRAAHVLGRWLERQARDSGVAYRSGPRGRRVLELGSGCGVVGLLCAQLGSAQVALTDQADVVAHLRHNASLVGATGSVSVRELAWGTDISDSFPRGGYDLIIGSDLTYWEHLALPLLISLLQLVDERTEVLLAHGCRRGSSVETWRRHFDRFFVIEAVETDGNTSLLEGLLDQPPDPVAEELQTAVVIFRLRLRDAPPSRADIDEMIRSHSAWSGQAELCPSELQNSKSRRSREEMLILPEEAASQDRAFARTWRTAFSRMFPSKS